MADQNVQAPQDDSGTLVVQDASSLPKPQGQEPTPPQGDELIGGKFKSQDDLLKAYEELQKKMGGAADSDETPPEGDQPSADEGGDSPATFLTDEKTDEDRQWEVDTYGTQIAGIMDMVNLDAKAVNEHWQKTGEFPEEAFAALENGGINRDMVQVYLQGMSVGEANEVIMEANDIKLLKSVDLTQEGYDALRTWGRNTLSAGEMNSFNQIMDTGTEGQKAWAVDNLKNKYMKTFGQAPNLIDGSPAATREETFGTAAEVRKAMKDPRYKTDPAYRREVAAKLSRKPVFTRG